MSASLRRALKPDSWAAPLEPWQSGELQMVNGYLAQGTATAVADPKVIPGAGKLLEPCK